MTERERKAVRFLIIAAAVLFVALAASALIDFGAALHDATHGH